MTKTGSLSRTRYTAYVIILIFCTILLYFFWVRGMRFFLVPSESMEPALYPNDYIVTLAQPEYRRGDVVVAVDPLDRDRLSFIVKRIVGVGGDTIRIEGGALFLNGVYASEPYVYDPPHYDFPPDPNVMEYTVPPNTVFLLGDNRNRSEDSSDSVWVDRGVYGTHELPLEDIVGRVERIYLPWDHASAVRHYPLVTVADVRPTQDAPAQEMLD